MPNSKRRGGEKLTDPRLPIERRVERIGARFSDPDLRASSADPLLEHGRRSRPDTLEEEVAERRHLAAPDGFRGLEPLELVETAAARREPTLVRSVLRRAEHVEARRPA